MPIPSILIPGAASSDPDFVPLLDPKLQLLADARITRWFVARDNDVILDPDAPTKIATMIDRKGVGNGSASADDALKPVLSTLSAYGGRKAAVLTAGADRSVSLPGLDLSGSAWFIAILARRANVDATNGDTLFRADSGATQVRFGTPSSGSVFQFFRNSVGVNINPGNSSPDTTPKLIFGSWDGTTIKGAYGSTGATTTVAGTGSALPANSPAVIGKGSNTPITYWGGDWAQAIFGNVDILAAGNADLRAMISEYLSKYYGLTL